MASKLPVLKQKLTTVRRRILFAVSCMTAGMLAVLILLHAFEMREQKVLSKHDCDERALYFSKLIQLNSSALKSVDFDNSYWDDLVTFTEKPNLSWAARNIDNIIDPNKVDGMWIYSTGSKIIYASTTADILKIKNNPIDSGEIAKKIGAKQALHCFVQFGSHVMELYGEPIVPSNDQAHVTQPHGYLLAGRLWDDDFVQRMSKLTDASATLIMNSQDTSLMESSAMKDKIKFSEGCFDLQGHLVGRLQLETADPTFTALQNSSDRLVVYLSLFGGLLIGTVSTCLLVWVSYPIEKVVMALKSENPQMLSSLIKESTEFGTIARLVDDFVSQQQELRNARDFLEEIVHERTRELEDVNQRLTCSYEAVIAGWGRALDLRDHETEGHCIRVTEMSLRLAKLFGFTSDELMHIERGALLHDIGKMGVPDSILLKNGELTEAEREAMQLHTVYAYEMLYPIEFLRPALEIPFCHHEKWDGTGYPRGLKGEDIPLSARIFAIADVADALSSDRPYRAAWPAQRVRDHIRKLSGTHFDPRTVEAYLAETIGDEDIKIDFDSYDGPPEFRLAA